MRVPDRLIVATKNPDKAAEMWAVLHRVLPEVALVTGLDWSDVAETGVTLEENAILKARAVAAATGIPALADDTGLEVAALGGLPGVRTARFAGEGADYAANRHALLAALQEVDDRRARFRTVVALAASDEVVTAVGEVSGVITEAERGTGGFGYDPVFAVSGHTMAELGVDAKNRLSHRARAIEALAALLRSGTDGMEPRNGGGVT